MSTEIDTRYLLGARTRPEWARYKARDSDGIMYWYECKPSKSCVDWQATEGRYAPVFDETWVDSLEEFLD